MNFDAATIITIIVVLMVGILIGHCICCHRCGKCPFACLFGKGDETTIKANGDVKVEIQSDETHPPQTESEQAAEDAEIEAKVAGGDITCFNPKGLEIVSVTVRDPYNQLSQMETLTIRAEGQVGGMTKQQKEMMKEVLKFTINTFFALMYDQKSLGRMANAMLAETIKLQNGSNISRAQQFDLILFGRKANYGSGLMVQLMKVFQKADENSTGITDVVLELGEVIRSTVFVGAPQRLVGWLTSLNSMLMGLYNDKDKFSSSVLITTFLSALVGMLITSFSRQSGALAKWFKQTTNEEISAFTSLMIFIENSINSTLDATGKLGNALGKISKSEKLMSAKERMFMLHVGIGNWDWGVLFRELIPGLLTVCKTASQAENIISAILMRNPKVLLPKDDTVDFVDICKRLRTTSSGEEDDGMEFFAVDEPVNEVPVAVPKIEETSAANTTVAAGY